MELPLFPLHTVLFPGGSLPLQIFEPRYREMMDRVLGADRRFGIIAIRRGMEVGGPAETYDVGCVAEVRQMQRAPDGAMQLIAEGRRRFTIEHRLPDEPYPRAIVRELDETEGAGAADLLGAARAATRRYCGAVALVQGTDVVVPAIPDEPVAASFSIASALQLDLPDRQRLLEAPDASARLVLATELAKREALLLEAVGPSVGHPGDKISLN